MKDLSRRSLIRQTGLVGMSLAVDQAFSMIGAAEDKTERATQPKAKLKVVVTGGHPGDPEYGCGGTIARLAAAGNEVVLL